MNDNLIQGIVEYLISEGTSNTTSGNYRILYSEISEVFNIEESWIKAHRNDITERLDASKEIIGETWGEENNEFDMNFGLAYCPNYSDDYDLGTYF